jgi:hypothetical protein
MVFLGEQQQLLLLLLYWVQKAARALDLLKVRRVTRLMTVVNPSLLEALRLLGGDGVGGVWKALQTKVKMTARINLWLPQNRRMSN